MSEKLAVILLDALDAHNIRMFDGFEFLREQYQANGDVLGISSLPHTAQSNPLIWGGHWNEDKFWVEGAHDWIDPAMHFDRDTAEASEETSLYTRDDLDTSFIWDDLDAAGLNACALQVPITLPPYSFNHEGELVDAWFPDTEPRMKEHIRRKSQLIRDHAESGYDFIGTSIQMPDKWLHGVAESKCTEEFMQDEAGVLDRRMDRVIDTLEAEGFDWIVCGDHGSPHPGAMPVREAKELLPRHRKESIIFGSVDSLPAYTDELYPFMLDYFGIEETETPQAHRVGDSETPTQEVQGRLENLGYK